MAKVVRSTHHMTQRHGRGVQPRIASVDVGRSRVTRNNNVIRKAGPARKPSASSGCLGLIGLLSLGAVVLSKALRPGR